MLFLHLPRCDLSMLSMNSTFLPKRAAKIRTFLLSANFFQKNLENLRSTKDTQQKRKRVKRLITPIDNHLGQKMRLREIFAESSPGRLSRQTTVARQHPEACSQRIGSFPPKRFPQFPVTFWTSKRSRESLSILASHTSREQT